MAFQEAFKISPFFASIFLWILGPSWPPERNGKKKEMEKNNNLTLLRLGKKNMMRDVSKAIEEGYTVVIENMYEKMDAVMMPVVSRQIYLRGTRQFVSLGDDEIAWNSSFKLILHTKLANPHFPSALSANWRFS